jgi:superfamily II DNA or RNA helicase
MDSSTPSVQNKYDVFQSKAVNRIVGDYTQKPNGRYLLVIPTGGGKTYTAVKSIAELFKEGILNQKEGDTVLWIAHRQELVDQAESTLREYFSQNGLKDLLGNIEVAMISQLEASLASTQKIKLVVIDEAHHSAAPSYAAAFNYPEIGILGLTATPSRHDGALLPFERESYSIGFPDLVKQGIVLRPKEFTIDGGEYREIESLSEGSSAQLNILNNEQRNDAIANVILQGKDEFNKIVIFVGTTSHTKALAEHLISFGLKKYYDSITWITGEGNSLGIPRDAFIEREKRLTKSIIVNVDVLTEGYDDPSIDTVVMARPTRSKLVYMQAMGRCIRHDPDNPAKVAKLIQVHDRLPNIRYWIENRMLYSDVSDILEPDITDIECTSAEDFHRQAETIFKKYQVPCEFTSEIPQFDAEDRYSLLLFKVFVAKGSYLHYPIWLSRDNRQDVTNAFNTLSSRMEKYKRSSNSIHPNKALSAARAKPSDFGPPNRQALIFEAMKNAQVIGSFDDVEKAGWPWITYYAIHYNALQLPNDLVAFCNPLVNKDAILDSIRKGDYSPHDILIRVPLPLINSIGFIVDQADFDQLVSIREKLESIAREHGDQDHYRNVKEFVDNEYFPLPPRFIDGFITSCREGDHFFHKLVQL